MAILRILAAFFLGAIVFSAKSFLEAGLLAHPDPCVSNPWTVYGVGTMAGFLLALLVMRLVSARDLGRFGLRAPSGGKLYMFAVVGLCIGIVLTAVEPILGVERHALLEGLSLPQILLFVLLLVPAFEELVARGLVQGYLEPLSTYGVSAGGVRLSLPVLAGAVFFALLHVGLVTLGMSLSTVAYYVAASFLVGALAGYIREKTGSLIPAIVLHAAINAGGEGVDQLFSLFS